MIYQIIKDIFIIATCGVAAAFIGAATGITVGGTWITLVIAYIFISSWLASKEE